LNKLKDDIIADMKKGIEDTVNEDQNLQNQTTEDLRNADDKLTDLEKKIEDASSGIRDPDKLANLARLKKKIQDAKEKKDDLAGDNNENKEDLKGVVDSFNGVNPEDDLISQLGQVAKQ